MITPDFWQPVVRLLARTVCPTLFYLSALLLSCNGEDTINVTKPLAIERLEEEAGYGVLWPRVLPSATDPMPQAEYDSQNKEVRLSYYPHDDAPGFGAPIIFVFQSLDPEASYCPPCPATDRTPLEKIDLNDRLFYLHEARTFPNSVSLALYFRDQGIRVEVLFDWPIAPGEPLVITESMKEQALEVVGSMPST